MKKQKKSKGKLKILLIILIFLIVIVAGIGIYAKNTNLFYKMKVVKSSNYEEIMEEAKVLNEDEKYYLLYISLKNVLTPDKLYGNTVGELIEQGKETMKNDGFTVKAYKEKIEKEKDNNENVTADNNKSLDTKGSLKDGNTEKSTFKDKVMNEDNIDEIFTEAEEKLTENELCYLLYICQKHSNNEEDIKNNLLNKSVEELLKQGKKEMKKDGITVEEYKKQLADDDINTKNEDVSNDNNNENAEGKLGDYYVIKDEYPLKGKDYNDYLQHLQRQKHSRQKGRE